MGWSLKLAVAAAVLLSGCHLFGIRTATGLTVPPIVGRAVFPASRQVQAAGSDVSTAATISLIDPNQSETVSTTLTDTSGSFSLQPGFAPNVQVYYLEAVKGLDNNIAGNDAARLRTLVEWTGSAWLSVASGSDSLSLGTTALSAIVALRQSYTPVDATLLMNTLTLGPPDTFDSTGTGISGSEYSTVYGLVSQILGNDGDPLHYLTFDGTTYSSMLAVTATSPSIELVSPDPAWPGATITVYGRNFDATLSNNSLTLNGAALTLTGGDTSHLITTLPSSASSGTLWLVSPGGTASAELTIIPSVNGTTNATGSLPFAGSGTTITGNVSS